MVKYLPAKNVRPKSPTAMSPTLRSLSKTLILIVRRKQLDEKSRDTKKLKDDGSTCKPLMVKYYGKEFYSKIPTVKKSNNKNSDVYWLTQNMFLFYVDNINSCGTLS